MKTSYEQQERLKFLMRVVKKEVRHLEYAAGQVFDGDLNYEAVTQLDATPELAMRVEAFSSRFCRLQDTLGDKFLPALLKALGEPDRALLINLEKAEKYGWLDSSEDWITLRQLRNQMIHEYIENPRVLFDALTAAYANMSILQNMANSLEVQANKVLK